MKKALVFGAVVLGCAFPLGAAEFLGVDVCKDSIDTSIELPGGSPLSINSVEVGKHGALVILLEGDGKETLGQVDDLMLGYTGARGVGDNKSLQWSGRSLTAFAEVVKKGFVALAVSSPDSCQDEMTSQEAPKELLAPVSESVTEPVEDIATVTEIAAVADEVVAVAVPVAAETVAGDSVEVETSGVVEDFAVRGDIVHMKAADAWVDVMGVVANNSGQGYKLASFDLSFYDASHDLICVDTISVSVLKDGQERAFRDSIQCPGYVASQVARTEMQFAGGY